MLGILVHGDNHFIVNGPNPSARQARALAWNWERPTLESPKQSGPDLSAWSICTKAFREHLEWAVVIEGDGPHSDAVAQLLHELQARGIAIQTV